MKPIADPHIHDLKWEEGAAVTFTFHVEVKPEITLARLGGFTLQRQVAPVTDLQVQEQLDSLREQKAPWAPVPGEKPKPKDLVHVTIAQREGTEAKDPQPYHFVLGEGRAIPEVEERVMAMTPGETVDATVRFPDDFRGGSQARPDARHPADAARGEAPGAAAAGRRVRAGDRRLRVARRAAPGRARGPGARRRPRSRRQGARRPRDRRSSRRTTSPRRGRWWSG